MAPAPFGRREGPPTGRAAVEARGVDHTMSLGLDHWRLFANERHVGSALDEVIWDEPRDEPRPGGPPVNGSGVLVVS